MLDKELLSFDTVEDIKQAMTETLNELRLSGTSSLTSKARVLIFGYMSMLDVIEANDFELRLKKLEERYRNES